LFTTREPKLANKLVISPTDVYNVDVLSPDTSHRLFGVFASNIVNTYPEKSKILVAKLNGSPLAIRVAAAMLSVEHQLGWDVAQLIDDIIEGGKLLQADAPLDRMNAETGETPTVFLVLNQSFQRLSAEQQVHFAKLGVFAAKPATFGLDAIKSV
jgi:hypothetical protein